MEIDMFFFLFASHFIVHRKAQVKESETNVHHDRVVESQARR